MTTYTFGSYTVEIFTSTGAFTWTPPAGVTAYDALVVAGGGGGGSGQGNGSGAGGAGRLLWLTAQSCTPGVGISGSVGVAGTGGTAGVLRARWRRWELRPGLQYSNGRRRRRCGLVGHITEQRSRGRLGRRGWQVYQRQHRDRWCRHWRPRQQRRRREGQRR